MQKIHPKVAQLIKFSNEDKKFPYGHCPKCDRKILSTGWLREYACKNACFKVYEHEPYTFIYNAVGLKHGEYYVTYNFISGDLSMTGKLYFKRNLPPEEVEPTIDFFIDKIEFYITFS